MTRIFICVCIILCLFFKTNTQGQVVNSIDISSAQQTNNPSTTFNAWQLIAMTDDMKNSYCYGNTNGHFPPTGTAISPEPLNKPLVVIQPFPGWPTGTYLSCYAGNTIYTPLVSVDNATACAMTIRRTFRVCSNSNEKVSFNFGVVCDNFIVSVIVDAGTPTPIILSNTLINGLSNPLTINAEYSLAPGLHTIDIVCSNDEEVAGVYYPLGATSVMWNPFGVDIHGGVSSVNNTLINDNTTVCNFAPNGPMGCNNWLNVPANQDGVNIGDLDITGNAITVEGVFNRFTAYSGTSGTTDIVSKHDNPSDVNYLLRGEGAAITTTNGFFSTPAVCAIEPNKTYHVAMVYDGSALKFYRNGFLLSQVAATGNLITNDYITRIGNKAGFYPAIEVAEGIINEVRIWGLARSQTDINAFMDLSLPNPTAQVGLLAYYTFDNLLNKQGNAAWNGSLLGTASINSTNASCTLFADSCKIATVTPDFIAPDTVCVGTPVTITNNTVGASSYYWSFCSVNVNTSPTSANLGNPGGLLATPVFCDYVKDDAGNYFVFFTNYSTGNLVRLSYGNSMLNTPTTTNLGNFGGILPAPGAEGISIVYNEGKWYAIIVGGLTPVNSPKIVKISFGASLANPNPVATDWGDIGGFSFPHDLFVFEENGSWYGFVLNKNNNTISKISFTSSFENTPTGQNLGNLGGLDYPAGIFAIKDAGTWHLFVANSHQDPLGVNHGGGSITRIDFNNSLLNAPTNVVNLGNIGGQINMPRDISLMNVCGNIVGFVPNQFTHDIVRLDFTSGVSAVPVATSLGALGNFVYPHSISRLFRDGADLYFFVPDINNNTITRFKFAGCTNASPASSTLQNPPPVIYNTPGTYNINLSIDDGLPTQSSICKQVVVLPAINADFSFKQDLCEPRKMLFYGSATNGQVQWDFGDGSPLSNVLHPSHLYLNGGTYLVTYKVLSGCPGTISKNIFVGIEFADIVLNPDTVICKNGKVQMRASPGVEYCWTPAAYLNNTTIQNPVATPPKDMTYYFTSKILGKNLVLNGDFDAGNSGFTSSYLYNNLTGFPEGVYSVEFSPNPWHPNMPFCKDHTSGSGKMMVVNGAPALGTKVWTETIQVSPNTSYEFACWAQNITFQSPSKLQFSINGVAIEDVFKVNESSCIWERFYANWNSGSNTTAIVTILNQNTEISGNDFALDDLSFAPVNYRWDSIIIKVDSPFVKTRADSIVCTGAEVQLNTTGNVDTYSWSPIAGLSDTLIARPLATVASSTTYIVTGSTIHGCMAKDTVTITLRPIPDMGVGNTSPAACLGQSVQLLAYGGNVYSWSPPLGLSNANIANPIATVPANQNYTVTISDSICKTQNIVVVPVNISPVPTITVTKSNDVTCNTPFAQLQVHGAGASYEWTPIRGLSDPAIANPIATPSTTTTYYVVVESENGCTAKGSVEVPVIDNDDMRLFKMPNAFTPNGDGLNDCFGLAKWGKVNIIYFDIYSRWGEKVFSGSNANSCWDGSYKGHAQSGNNFVYKIKVQTICGVVERKGDFVLIR